jgi:DNA-directed RNA polymerase subunit RPC12/RpoP
MLDTFNCPNCGAPLDNHGSDPMVRCPYCNTSVIVPKKFRAKPTSQPVAQPVQPVELSHTEPSYGSAAADRRARKAAMKRGKERHKAEEQLKKLKELHAAKMISDEEYVQKRAEIIKEL